MELMILLVRLTFINVTKIRKGIKMKESEHSYLEWQSNVNRNFKMLFGVLIAVVLLFVVAVIGVLIIQ